VLQRTGDPSNLGHLTPALELLANIDHNPGEPPETPYRDLTIMNPPDTR